MRKVAVAGIGSILWLYLLFLEPVVAVIGETGVLSVFPAGEDVSVDIIFIHSAQKTKVIEHLVVNERLDGFCLQATEYSSFGFGLPFLSSDGSFSITEEGFSMKDMNRPVPSLSLRAGVDTHLTLYLAGQPLPLYEILPLGERVDVKILPSYQLLQLLVSGMFKEII